MTKIQPPSLLEGLGVKALVARKRRLVRKMEGLGDALREFKYSKTGRLPYTEMERELVFWSNVSISKSGCWMWIGKLKDGRYGSFWFRGKNERSHRASWMICFGAIAIRMEVMHACDNTLCVRPDHLVLGSHALNMSDMVSKGRSARGELASKAKLTSENVKWIRDNYVFGSRVFGSVAIGVRFGVASNSILSVVKGRNWKYE